MLIVIVVVIVQAIRTHKLRQLLSLRLISASRKSDTTGFFAMLVGTSKDELIFTPFTPKRKL